MSSEQSGPSEQGGPSEQSDPFEQSGSSEQSGPSDAEGPGYEVLSSEVVFRGKVVTVRKDEVAMPGGASAQRDVVAHPGAVGVVAVDDEDRVLMLRQYRHPVGRYLWELPAGLLDVEGEPASAAAARELGEEAGMQAGRWDVLVDALTSPGMTSEAIRLFLARDVSAQADDGGFTKVDEEADLQVEWVPLDAAVARVLSGDITNAMACLGVLAAAHARNGSYAGLRTVDAPWPARPQHQG